MTEDDVVVTRLNSNLILPGCTRLSLLQLIAETGMKLEERSPLMKPMRQRKPSPAQAHLLYTDHRHRREDHRHGEIRSSCPAPARNLYLDHAPNGDLKTELPHASEAGQDFGYGEPKWWSLRADAKCTKGT